jgi:competence ComEA-like helix-hairpin-helix protein
MKLNKFTYLFKAYFTYSNRERNAIVVLLVLIFVMQISLFALHWIPSKNVGTNVDAVTKSKLEVLKSYSTDSVSEKSYHKTERKIALKEFNPNEISIDEWMDLGLSEKQAAVLVRWRDKKPFQTKADVRKVFVVKENLYLQWEPYILLPENVDVPTQKKETKDFQNTLPQKTITLLNINSATVEEFDALPLIGEGRAKAMVRYRDYLGGFVSTEQLREIKMLPDSVLEVILPRVKTDGKVLKYLNINADTLRHPYLPKPMATIIVNYRVQHGAYENVEDLSKISLLDAEIMRKLAPYLTVNSK